MHVLKGQVGILFSAYSFPSLSHEFRIFNLSLFSPSQVVTNQKFIKKELIEIEINMGKIILFNDILAKLAEDKTKRYLLFGERNIIKSESAGKTNSYDLVFHLREGDYGELEEEIAKEIASLVIPVLLPEGAYKKEIARIDEHYRKNPSSCILGINNNPLKLYRAERIVNANQILEWSFSSANRKEFFDKADASSCQELEEDLAEKIALIDRKYQ